MKVKCKDIMELAGFTENEIKKFTSAMRNKLLQNSKKGDSWKKCNYGYLVSKLVEEFCEYINVDKNGQKSPIEARDELVDIANIAMMLFLRIEMDI